MSLPVDSCWSFLSCDGPSAARSVSVAVRSLPHTFINLQGLTACLSEKTKSGLGFLVEGLRLRVLRVRKSVLKEFSIGFKGSKKLYESLPVRSGRMIPSFCLLLLCLCVNSESH